ncbi:MAG: F0F1 ATP synthase subunit epsilon [Eubacteriales bacterium]
MASTFNFKVVSPDGLVFDQEVEFVVVPGEEGELGVLPNHAPLIAGLNIGVIRYKVNNTEKMIAICGGFMEVADNKVSVLAESAECAESIDVTRAESAKDRAEKRLKEKSAEIDLKRAELALRRAVTRLKASR